LSVIQKGKIMPHMREKPRIMRLRDDRTSTNCRLEKATPTSIPSPTIVFPPVRESECMRGALRRIIVGFRQLRQLRQLRASEDFFMNLNWLVLVDHNEE
jgi:hypothetical protein